MTKFKAEAGAELEFDFPDDLNWMELDVQGVALPYRMKFVDLVIERKKDILLVEIKDPCHSKAPVAERKRYVKRLSDNSILKQELTPKARDSYTYMHLMKRDNKPFKYIVLLALDALDQPGVIPLLSGFKDRLLHNIRNEGQGWKRHYIQDCVVLSVAQWNRHFGDWPIVRLSTVIPPVLTDRGVN